MSVRELARRTHYSHSYVSKVENGVKVASIGLAERCDMVLDMGGALVEVLRASEAPAVSDHDDRIRPLQLPPGPTRFVGRAAELCRLTAALVPEQRPAGAVPMVAVDGPPGVGKSALVFRWAHENSHHFPDGVLFADLGGHGGDPQAPRAVLEDFLSALNGRALPTIGQPAALLRSLLHGRKVLIVLDNAASVQQVRALLPGAPGCAIVVTSRHRLPGLSVRDGARRITVEPLADADAVELLSQTMGEDRVQADPEGAAAIARICGGLPLAVQLAGERLTTMPSKALHTFATELEVEEHGLTMLSVIGDPRSAVRTVFSWSYRALDPGDARVFRQLGLHPNAEFSTDVAAVATGLGPAETECALQRLAAAHLIEPAGPQRYKLHSLLRMYARERARHDPVPWWPTGAVRLSGPVTRIPGWDMKWGREDAAM